MTSDERIEIAARLRKTRGIMAFVEALGIDPDGDWCWTDVSRRVADLIDPTCHDVGDQYDGGCFECSRCGEMWEMICGSPSDNNLNFCPHCGARLVERGED